MNRIIFVTISILSFVTLSYSHIPNFLKNSNLNKLKKAERTVTNNAVEFQFKDIEPGHYFLSLGRTSVSCNVNTSSGHNYRATSLDNNRRISLIAGFDFLVKDRTDNFAINISCPNRAPKTYKMKPFVSNYYIGMIVNLFELLFYVIMTPFSSLIVFLSSIYLFRREKAISTKSYEDYKNLLLFSLCTLLYAISFSQIPKLFFDSEFTAANHILIRFLLHASFLSFISKGIETRIRKTFVATYVLIGLSTFTVAKVFDIGTASYIYARLLFTFPLTTFIFLFLKKKKMSSNINRLEFLKIAMLGTYMLNCLHDAISWFVGSSTYSTPGTIMFISISTAIALQIQSEVEAKISKIKDKIEESFQKSSSLTQYLERISKLFAREFGFDRASVYVDGHIYGHSFESKKSFLRVYELGYIKETSTDKEILLQEDHEAGRRMIGFQEDDIGTLKYGNDGGIYTIFPYDEKLYINLSSRTKTGLYELSFKRILLSNLSHFQERVQVHFDQLMVDAIGGLDLLRGQRGKGTHMMTIGTIFLDIVDYSVHTKEYGSAYTTFVTEVFFKDLLSRLRNVCILENFIGDEIHLKVIPDLLSVDDNDENAITEATLDAILTIQNYIEGHGKNRAMSLGFPPVDVSLGVTVGNAELNVTESAITTAGACVNLAKRLQSTCRPGHFLLGYEFTKTLNESGLTFNEKKYIVKKDFFIALEIQCKAFRVEQKTSA